MELILKSKRVRDDILIRLLQSDSTNKFQMIIAIRQWYDIYPGFEFRGFVYKNKLNALSQYFENLHLPELVDTKESIEEMIIKVFNKMVINLVQI